MIEQRMRLEGSRGEREVTALFDSGASVSCIRPDVAREIADPVRLPKPLDIWLGETKAHLKEVHERVPLDFYIGEHRFFGDFYLVLGLVDEVVIGAATMRQWRFKLDFDREEVILDPSVERMRI
jgi:hypothetical protein